MRFRVMDYFYFRKYILSFILLFISLPIWSRHIIGSDFYYTCLSGTNPTGNTRSYALSLTIFRDCYNPQGSPYDPDASFGIYRRSSNGRYTFVQKFTVNHGPIRNVPKDNNPCLIPPPIVCVEESAYNFQVALPVIDETYVIYYMRCCRNNTIINLIQPNNTGATFYIEISPDAQRSCNNSPRFKNFPPTIVCADYPLEFDHSATDQEGDSLVYEFCTPLAGGGNGQGIPGGGLGCGAIRPDPAICAPPFEFVSFQQPFFSTNDPMGPGVLQLDRLTGKLDGLPNELGQYVIGICVNEYRAGKLIGSIHRDFQFNIGICEEAVEAKVAADTSIGKTFSVNFCGDKKVTIKNESFREEYIKSYHWEFTSVDNPSGGTLTSTSRDAVIDFPNPGKYKGTMIVNKNSIICNDTAYVELNIIPSDLNAAFDFVYDKCSSSPIQFNDKSTGIKTPIKKWIWDFKDGLSSTTRSPSHLYKNPGNYKVKLTVSDGKICKDEFEKDLSYFPSPELIDLLPDKFRACVPATIHFDNLSIPLDSNYQVEWDFGDGNKAKSLDAVHTYTKPGNYTIGMSIKAPSGCITTESFPSFVRVQDGPIANFDYNPKEITTLNPVVQFSNLSINAVSVQWNFGDEQASEEKNPTHKYRDTGRYKVVQIVRHENGCIDTASKLVEIGQYISYFLPNAFSPNNDGINDIYFGSGSTKGMQDFNMGIFNRWGERIFFSEDPNSGWNGRKFNKGNIEAPGVYVCIVKYKTDKNEQREIKSFVTLVR